MTGEQGVDTAARQMSGWGSQVAEQLHSRMEHVADLLQERAVEEQAASGNGVNSSATVRAWIDDEQVTAERIVLFLSAERDGMQWQSNVHGGRWAWLWAVIFRHKDELMAALGKQE